MKLFIIRHGESVGNKEKRHQTAAEPLTKLGLLQASKVAQRFTNIHIDTLIASPMKRAQQTAQEVSAITGTPITTDLLFREKNSPSEIQGKSYRHDPHAQIVSELIRKHSLDPEYHYSDEENNFDFIQRVARGWWSLEQYVDQEHVVVVAHGHVLRVLFGLIVFGVEFSPREFELMTQRIITSNAGITMCQYTREHGWELIAYNDHAHVLE